MNGFEYRNTITLRSYSLKELRHLYGVSEYIFRKWIKAIEADLGKREAGLYNIKQVHYIFDALGVPGFEITSF